MPECEKCKSKSTYEDGHIHHVKGCVHWDEAPKGVDMFKREELAIKHCEQHGIERGTKEYSVALAAFASGCEVDKSPHTEQYEGCECLCPVLDDGRCRKENASCYMVKKDKCTTERMCNNCYSGQGKCLNHQKGTSR